MSMTLNDEQLDYQKRSARIFQQRFDEALREIGWRAPQPVIGQPPNDYRREVLRAVKKTYLENHQLGRVNMRGLPDEVLDNFESQVVNAAIAEATNPRNVPPGELRRVDKLDPFGRLAESRYYGESFVKFPEYGHRPGRRVTSFLTPHGRVNAAGQPVR